MQYKSPTRPAQADFRSSQATQRGPVPLDPKFLPLVGGGLPRTYWGSDSATTDGPQLPRTGW